MKALRSSRARVVAAALVSLWASSIAPSTFAASNYVENIMINYKATCDAPVQSLNLGNMSISVNQGTGGNAGGTVMRADFNVSAAGQASPIWNCMSLHFIQYIYYDACPAQYYGTNVDGTKSIIDPPNGGWDYMYTNNNRSMGVKPGYNIFVDNKPWYYNAAGEASGTASDGTKFVQDCKRYIIEDVPSYCPTNGDTKFITLLVAEAKTTCPDSPNCLAANQMQILADFGWVDNSTDARISSYTSTPGQGDADSLNQALGGTGGFSDWTAYVDKVISCPEPGCGTFLLVGLAALLRRHVKRAT